MAQSASQAKVQEAQFQAQIDLEKEARLSAIRIQERAQMLQIEEPSKVTEFQRDAYLEQLKAMTTIELTKYKEDQKSQREQANSTRQSKMIEQRQKDLPAFDFSKEFNIKELLQA